MDKSRRNEPKQARGWSTEETKWGALKSSKNASASSEKIVYNGKGVKVNVI